MPICPNRLSYLVDTTFSKKLYGIADISTIIKEKSYRTLENFTSAWLDDIRVFTIGDRAEHENIMFYVLKNLENAGYQARETKSGFFLNEIKWLVDEIDETGTEPNKEKVKAKLVLEHRRKQKN